MTLILIAIAAQVAVSLALILWTRSRVRRFLGSDDELDRIRREISALIIELDASADRNVTVLEDRLASLKDALAEADKRLAVLGQERARRQPEGQTYDRLGRVADTAPQAAPPGEPPPGYGLRRETAPIGDAEVPFIRFSDTPLSTEEPFADKVIALARRGFSSDIIAARLEATMAEVDLVLSLEREREERSKER